MKPADKVNRYIWKTLTGKWHYKMLVVLTMVNDSKMGMNGEMMRADFISSAMIPSNQAVASLYKAREVF